MRILLAAALLVSPALAAAATKGRAVYAGVGFGAHLLLNEWPLRDPEETEAWPRSSPVLALRGGYQPLDWLGAEAEVGLLPLASTEDGANAALTGSAAAHLRVTRLGFDLGGRPWLPVVAAGGGVYHNVTGDLGSDTDAQVHLGLGLHGELTDSTVIRLEVRDVWSDNSELHGPGNNLLVTLGLDVLP